MGRITLSECDNEHWPINYARLFILSAVSPSRISYHQPLRSHRNSSSLALLLITRTDVREFFHLDYTRARKASERASDCSNRRAPSLSFASSRFGTLRFQNVRRLKEHSKRVSSFKRLLVDLRNVDRQGQDRRFDPGIFSNGEDFHGAFERRVTRLDSRTLESIERSRRRRAFIRDSIRGFR